MTGTIKLFVATLVAMTFTISAGAAQPAKSVANAGTLTCVVSPVTKGPFGVERELSCNFDRTLGANAKFKGIVKRLGGKTAGTGKIVLVWSVLAPSTDVALEKLAGRYVGTLGATPAGKARAEGLVGGENRAIRLQPLTAAPNVGANSAVSVLELELSAMKA